MLKFAIVDDEHIFIESFVEKLGKYIQEGIDELYIFENSVDFLKSDTIYDLVFLDIDIPEIDGIAVAKKRMNKSEKIVFVTNVESLVFRAYNATSAIGFVRKSHLEDDLRDVFLMIKNLKKDERYITVKKGANLINISCKDIYYFEKQVNDVIIHTVNGEVTYRQTIKELEKQLSDCGFIKNHEGYLVNVDYIYCIGTSEIILTNKSKIPISRKNVMRVKEAFLLRCGEDDV